MKSRKALVKVYRWHDLVRLAKQDMQAKMGERGEAELHYIGGLDTRGNPFIRIDLTPLPNLPKLKP